MRGWLERDGEWGPPSFFFFSSFLLRRQVGQQSVVLTLREHLAPVLWGRLFAGRLPGGYQLSCVYR